VSVVSLLGDEVIGPDVVRVLWPQADAGAVCEPETPALGLPGRYLEAFSPPDALYPLVVDLLAGHLQEVSDAPVAVAAELAGQGDDRLGERILITSHLWSPALAGAMLTESTTGPAFGDP